MTDKKAGLKVTQDTDGSAAYGDAYDEVQAEVVPVQDKPAVDQNSAAPEAQAAAAKAMDKLRKDDTLSDHDKIAQATAAGVAKQTQQ